MAAILLLSSAFVCTSCKKKVKDTETIIVPKEVVEQPKGTQTMKPLKTEKTVSWIDKTYTIFIERSADTSLPFTYDESDNRYYDNVVTLTVKRPDGTEFFSRTFKKKDFEQYLSDDMKTTGALLGIVFDKNDADNLYFAASIGSPDASSDYYTPFIVRLTRFGEISIKKDQNMDTGAVDNDEDFEDEI